MRKAFPQHFATDQSRREKLWENCLFVFDTNVLAGIYRRSDEARDAQYKLMVELGDRLWVPHRVIYEFLDNRAKIVQEQSQLYSECIGSLKEILASFEVPTRHPFLSTAVFAEFSAVSNKVIMELEEYKEFHSGRITNDDVKLKLAEIFEGKVGEPFSEERLIGIVKEGEARYEQKIPPGFEDKGKHKGSVIQEEIRKRYGDLIIWHQVIEKAKLEQRPVIMITGDQKPDWWAEQSGKTLGPHPGLIEEFNRETGQDFYLYSYHNFLDLANQYLNQQTSESVIEEIRESALMDSVEKGYTHYMVRSDGSTTIPDMNFRTKFIPNYYNSNVVVDNQELYDLIGQEVMLKIELDNLRRQDKELLEYLNSIESGAKSSPGTEQRILKKLLDNSAKMDLCQVRLDQVRMELGRVGFDHEE